MNMGWHEGELALQREAGVENSDLLRRGVRDHLTPVFMQFIAAQRMAVVATVDGRDRVWASIMAGAPGFLRAADDRTIDVNASSAAESRIVPHVRVHPTIGLLVMDPETRRRVRVNGTAHVTASGAITVSVRESFGNCQQYIQMRQVSSVREPVDGDVKPRVARALTGVQLQWINRADTFFIASHHPSSGADASHRGGKPGFVHAIDPATIVFPDYSGNNMFQTLGNLQVNPKSGLLFVDFETGRTLQLTGHARVSAAPSPPPTLAPREAPFASYPGAQRLVEYRVERAIELERGSALRAVLVEYSPFNPG